MKAFTLVELLITVFLISIILVSLLGVFAFSTKVVSLFSRKVNALEIGIGELEKIKNLPYLKIGTKGATLPLVPGVLEKKETLFFNNYHFLIEREIRGVVDETDGEESCPIDYKKAEIKIFYGRGEKDFVSLSSDIYPKTKEEELQFCQQYPSGILSVKVFDSKGELVEYPRIEIFNPETGEKIDEVFPQKGKYDFPLSPGEYLVSVSKTGFSRERTYGIQEIAHPLNPHPLILEGKTTNLSFSIDKLSELKVQTLSMWSEDYFLDSFLDESKISEKENIVIEEGSAKLATPTEGYLFSKEISPSQLVEWFSFSFSQQKPPNTDLKYQIYFASGTDWVLVPDEFLPGNSEGLRQSPVDLSHLPASLFFKLKIKGILSSLDGNSIPAIEDWRLSWKSAEGIPISDVSFEMRGEKIVGKDAADNEVFKFSTTTKTNLNGEILFENLEWDFYHFSNFKKDLQPLEMVTSSLPIPLSLAPGVKETLKIYLNSTNSFHLKVVDCTTLLPIFSAKATLSKDSFSTSQYTNENGETFFLLSESGEYQLSVEAPGYFSTSSSIFISGERSYLNCLALQD
ncbi:hypothetical protein H5T58_00160 [Candidatus Parcubacteria bacterium]|nr:hypothetical protein [Candidatus Parcubacteria bacterium]